MVLKMTMIMKLSLISSCCILLEARLVEKSAEKVTTTPEPDLVKSTLYHRIGRDIGDGDISSEMDSSNENMKENKPFRKVFKNRAAKMTQPSLARVARQSDQHFMDYEKLNKSIVEPTTEKRVLIKKPIPKFYEVDSDNDFQKLAESVNLKLVDSGVDHEDEDFNVGDYDFDVNHDEYAGRDRHLEPRVKKIENKIVSELQQQEKVKPRVLVPTPIESEKVAIPQQYKQNVKREYPYFNTYKPNVKRDEDYSDDTSSTTHSSVYSTEKESKTYDEDTYDDSIKDGNTKPRRGRSPIRM